VEVAIPLRLPKHYLAVVACLGGTLAACAAVAPRHAGAIAPAGVHSPGGHTRTWAGCPRGRLLPDGEAVAIDYVDFLRLGRRMYFASTGAITKSQLGHLITHVRCSLAAEEDQRHAEPPLISGTAAFLPVGSAIYQVRGYPASCRLAAYLHGRLQVYLAQDTVHRHAAPVPCALHRVFGRPRLPPAR